MNLKDFFQEKPVEFEGSGGSVLAFYFRNPTAEEETEFLRRISKQRIRTNGVFESTEASLAATLWLYEKLLKKITITNGTGTTEDVPSDEYGDVPGQTRRDAIASFRNRIKQKDSDDLRD